MEENKNYTSPTPETENDELEIDWMDILRRVIAIRKTLYKAAGIGLVLGIIIALSTPKQYTVSVTLAPEMGNDSKSGGLASLASSFLGGSMGNSPDALNAALSGEIVSSTPFLLELFDTRVQTLDGELDTTLAAYLDEQQGSWLGAVLSAPGRVIGAIKGLFTEEADTVTMLNPFQLTKEESQKVGALRKSITADIDKKTGITTLSVTLQDPKVTAMVADSVVNNTSSITGLPRRKRTAPTWKSCIASASRNITTPSSVMLGMWMQTKAWSSRVSVQSRNGCRTT